MSAELDIEAIRRRVPEWYAAPWRVDADPEGSEWTVAYATDNPLAGLVATLPDYGSDLAEFIAHAREDIPALIAEVERLRARLYPPPRLPWCPACEIRHDPPMHPFTGHARHPLSPPWPTS